MSLGLVLGAALGAAICLFIFSLVPPRPALGSELARWEKQQTRQQVKLASTWNAEGRQLQGRVGRWLVTQLTQRGIRLTRLRANLELLDKTIEEHMATKVAFGLGGFLLPVGTTAILVAVGVTPPFTVTLGAAVLVAALFFWIPDLDAAKEAQQRRTELRRALACYLDLVSMSLAGGRGLPEALPTAARIGTGWAFELLWSTIERARLRNETVWEAFAELGERVGLQELHDLGGALMLVAHDGAKVRLSLEARAATQRRRQLDEAASQVDKSNQSIQFASLLLTAGFFLFLLFPAVMAVMAV